MSVLDALGLLILIAGVVVAGLFGARALNAEGTLRITAAALNTALEATENARAEVTRLNDEVSRLGEDLAAEPKVPLTEEQRAALRAARCTHCGGSHSIACPRVARIRFRSNGEPLEVAYWRDDEWPKEQVVFDEDIGP